MIIILCRFIFHFRKIHIQMNESIMVFTFTVFFLCFSSIFKELLQTACVRASHPKQNAGGQVARLKKVAVFRRNNQLRTRAYHLSQGTYNLIDKWRRGIYEL